MHIEGLSYAAGAMSASAALGELNVSLSHLPMQEALTFISALILIWNMSIPGVAQFAGYFIGVGLSSWIIDEFFIDDR
jgi:hypothetical protein